jgi:hypothetical protein
MLGKLSGGGTSNTSRTHYLNQSSNLIGGGGPIFHGQMVPQGGAPGMGSFNKDSMIKNYNNYVLAAQQMQQH